MHRYADKYTLLLHDHHLATHDVQTLLQLLKAHALEVVDRLTVGIGLNGTCHNVARGRALVGEVHPDECGHLRLGVGDGVVGGDGLRLNTREVVADDLVAVLELRADGSLGGACPELSQAVGVAPAVVVLIRKLFRYGVVNVSHTPLVREG